MTCFRMSNGETLNQYCRRNGMCYCAIWNRLEKGWDIEKAVHTPFLGKNGAKYFINGKPARSQMSYNEYQVWRREHIKGNK